MTTPRIGRLRLAKPHRDRFKAEEAERRRHERLRAYLALGLAASSDPDWLQQEIDRVYSATPPAPRPSVLTKARRFILALKA